MNGKLVCNTGPLVALSIIDQLDVLKRLFELVAVPEAVHREILEGGTTNAGLSNYHKVQWIKASVILLAMELNADFILIDERKARKIARTVYGLKVIGSAGILVEAKRQGLIDNVGSALQIMRDNGYRIGDSIIDAALRKAGEF
jgi:predicted nucleic acid-binding protein